MKYSGIKCDECGKHKNGADDWISLQDQGYDLQISRDFDIDSGLHFCGIGCAIQFISRWLSEKR